MNTLKNLEQFRLINDSFPKTQEILDFKGKGGKVFGWLCTYVPEEILHAAGIIPVRITGYHQETELDDGNAYLYINNCSFSRSCLQMGLKGEYDYLDGIVAGSTCDGARRLFDLWVHYIELPFNHILTVPRKFTERAHRLYLEQVLKFKEHLEQHLENEITDEALLNSISVYNESRELMKKLYEIRKLDKPPISGAETMEVLNASQRMSKESFNRHLRDLLNELAQSNNEYQSKSRLMVTGSVMNNPEFIHSIEELGGLVVTDELCTSTRYWSDPVITDSNTPVEAISRRYLNNFPCARMVPSDDRFNRILQHIRDYKVDGVISQIIRYCVPYAHDLPLLSDRLKEAGIPLLSLDVEYGTSGSGQISTRVQAFLEMLETRKK